jgi:hypothetical protein
VIPELEALYEKLGERISEARATIKDVGYARKELEEQRRKLAEEITEARKTISKAHQEAIDTVMPKYMEDLGKAVGKAITDATDAVYRRFDTLSAIMMGEDDPDKESLSALVRRWRAAHK